MNVETKSFSDFNKFSNVCCELQNLNKKSQHIEFSNSSPKVVKGKQIDQKSIDDMIQFLTENARCSKQHKKIAARTICILEGVYSDTDKGKISKKLEKALKKVESISLKKPKTEIELENVRKGGKKYCDFTFFCRDGEKVEDHLSFIMQLPFFNELSEKWKDDLLKEKGFNLKQFPKEAVEIVLDLIYGQPFPENISDENLMWVYSLANFLNLDDLKELVGKEIEKHPENYVDKLICISREEERAFETEENSDQLETSQLAAAKFFIQDCCEFRDLSQVIPSEQKAKEVLPYFESLAEQNDAFAQTFLGNCYQQGLGVKQEPQKAVEFYIKASEQEFAPAQYHLGICYEKGLGVEKDLKLALVLYEQLSDKGFAPAQHCLGSCYENGLGVEKDVGLALALYKQASDQGFPRSQNRLGIHFHKLGGEENLKKAVDLYIKASDKGFVPALYNLGNRYLEGKGVEQNLYKAKELYTKASEQKYEDAQIKLGEALNKLGHYCEEVEKDPRKAFNFYSQAIGQGDMDSQIKLGQCYEKGIGIKKNPKIAFDLYAQASNKGSVPAKVSLGNCYLHGIGVKKDRKKAVQLFKEPAELGNADALFNLGCYYENDFLQGDFDIALEYYKKARDLGHPQARKKCKSLKRELARFNREHN